MIEEPNAENMHRLVKGWGRDKELFLKGIVHPKRDLC